MVVGDTNTATNSLSVDYYQLLQTVKGRNMRLVMAVSLVMILTSLMTLSQSQPIQMKFMCDICEANFLSCMLHCSLEQFITRDQFDR